VAQSQVQKAKKREKQGKPMLIYLADIKNDEIKNIYLLFDLKQYLRFQDSICFIHDFLLFLLLA